ncbi:Flp pilus assembly protein CpaB [Xinfangfangia sp. CPCC 101601]|uniref:Flp pilus assembly protein CpaB n=1 Tax=Pseudogemmobacter lacusdianii TaxID=3069608 RepID=A0ABU0VT39_9RHOB|nr:Flp pilus assembly protein CpaB [Xinfangfangia sp. CPCC 101601]MDQ2064891.1 Flp pilus assembly protein CpaB [Xinfangfangia sp. CPCC 101601]
MRAVFALVLVFGVALAGLAVYMAQNYVGQSQAAVARAQEFQQRTGPLVQVYAVNKAMSFGAPLTKDDVEIVYLQQSFLPAGAYLVPQEGQTITYTAAEPPKGDEVQIVTPTGPLFPENEDRPRYIMRSMEPHEIVLAGRVTDPGQVAGLTGKLEKGMRAFQIKVSATSGVADFVIPESYIDIYWTGAGGENVSGNVTRLIGSAYRVIAVDQASGEGQSMNSGGAKTVTVAATPEQVGLLAQAQATGSLTMSLVGSQDDVATDLIEVDSNKLLGIVKEEVVVVEAEVEKTCTIRTRKGADVVEIPIPCTN